MKTTVATALSLVGVIAAGSAAAMVNTTIFDTAPNEAAASAVIVPEAQTIDLTIPTPVAVAPSADPATTGTEDSSTPTASNSGSASSVSVVQSDDVQISSSSREVGVLATETSVEPTPTIAPTPSTTVPTPTTTAPTTPTTTVPPSSDLVTYNVGEAGSVTLDVIDGRLTIIDATPGAGWIVAKAEHYQVDNSVEVEFVSNTLEVKFEAMRVNGVIETEVHAQAIDGTPHHDDDDDDHDDDDHDDDDDDDDEHDDDDDDDDDDDHDDD